MQNIPGLKYSIYLVIVANLSATKIVINSFRLKAYEQFYLMYYRILSKDSYFGVYYISYFDGKIMSRFYDVVKIVLFNKKCLTRSKHLITLFSNI